MKFFQNIALTTLFLAVSLALLPSAAYAQACGFNGTLGVSPEQLAAGEPTQGNPEADVILVEFFAPNWPH